MVGVEEWPQAVEWQRANLLKPRGERADAQRKGSVPLLSATTRVRSLAAGAGVSGAALAGLIAMAVTLGGIFGFRGLGLGAGSSEGPALQLPPALRAGGGATPAGIPLPAVRLAAVARGAVLLTPVAPRPVRHAPRAGGNRPGATAPHPVTASPGTPPPSSSGAGSQTAPSTPPSSGSGPATAVTRAVAQAVSDTASSTGSAIQPVSPSGGDTVTAVGQAAAATVAATGPVVDQVVQTVTGAVPTPAAAVKLP